MVKSKKWYKSKTLWFNAAVVGGAVVAGVTGFLPVLQPFLTPKVFAVSTFTFGVINLVLRGISDHIITWKEEDARIIDKSTQ